MKHAHQSSRQVRPRAERIARAQLFTIGYQGVSAAEVLKTLRGARVTRLLDVRALPLSHRPGFSKTPLAQLLSTAHIHYQHEGALGAPRALRQRLRQEHDVQHFLTQFRRHLATQRARLDALARTLSGRVALLCFERDAAECHRSVVAAALARRMQSRVTHLQAGSGPARPGGALRRSGRGARRSAGARSAKRGTRG